MKLEDAVKRTIHKYPILYKDVNYARSRMKVLGHIFITNGNGVEFSKYGYLGHENIWKAYGEEKYEGPELDEAYFATDITHYTFKIEDLNSMAERSATREVLEHVIEMGLSVSVEESTHDFRPYPICNHARIYVAAHEKRFLQPDWLAGGFEVCRESLDYYKNPERYRFDHYFSSSNKILMGAREHIETWKKEGSDGYKKHRKMFCHKPGQTIVHRSVESWINFHTKTVASFVEILKLLGAEVSPDEIPATLDFDTLHSEVLESLENPLQYPPSCRRSSIDMLLSRLEGMEKGLSDSEKLHFKFARGEITVEEAVEALK